MSTEHEKDGLAERLRPVGLQCHEKVKEGRISLPQGSRNIHESMASAATAEWRRAGAIYNNHMSATDETIPLPPLLNRLSRHNHNSSRNREHSALHTNHHGSPYTAAGYA